MTKPGARGGGTIVDPPEEAPTGTAPEPLGPGQQDPDAAGRARPVAPWLLAAVAGVSALALVFALVAVSQRSKLSASRTRDRQLRQVSGQLVGALTTYDYQHLDTFRGAVLTNAAGSFRRDFDAKFPALRAVLAEDHSRATGTVSDIFLGPIDGGKATTLVRVIYTVTGLTGTRQIGSYDTLTVLKVNGRWQIDDIQTLLFNPNSTPGAGSGPASAPAGGPAPTATSLPTAGH